jgi:hypothetical protein
LGEPTGGGVICMPSPSPSPKQALKESESALATANRANIVVFIG